jgi:hypothetical protein
MRSDCASRVAFALALVLLPALLSSCVGNCAYRTKLGACSVASVQPDTTRETVPIKGSCCEGPAYWLSFVEFDDRGEMFDPRQLTHAVESIKAAQEQASGTGSNNGVNVVLFIHGWKNNASDKSGNVWGFRRSLKSIVRVFPATPTVGIYIGWRGDAVRPAFLKQLTIRDRGEKSRNLANAHTTEALLSIIMAAKGADFERRDTRLILVGHSFGAAVLESALTQTLINQVMRAHRGKESEHRHPSVNCPPPDADSETQAAAKKEAAQDEGSEIRPIADLVVYINQAAAANTSFQTLEFLKRHGVAFSGVRDVPLIINIASEADSATGLAFPGSQFVFFRARNSLRKYPCNLFGFQNQTRLFYETTAHIGALHSHTIQKSELSNRTGGQITKAHLNIKVDGACYDVIPIDGAVNNTPYWVSHLPARIVPDHSTIFTPQFETFLTSVILRNMDERLYLELNKECIPRGKEVSAPPQQQRLVVQ